MARRPPPAHSRGHVDDAQRLPRELRFLDALSRTGSGKIAKRFLRDGQGEA